MGRSSSQQRTSLKPACTRRCSVSLGPAKTHGDQSNSSGAHSRAAASIASRTRLMLPSPPHWISSTPPGRSARASREKRRSWSETQCKVAVETIASTGAVIRVCVPRGAYHSCLRLSGTEISSGCHVRACRFSRLAPGAISADGQHRRGESECRTSARGRGGLPGEATADGPGQVWEDQCLEASLCVAINASGDVVTSTTPPQSVAARVEDLQLLEVPPVEAAIARQ